MLCNTDKAYLKLYAIRKPTEEQLDVLIQQSIDSIPYNYLRINANFVQGILRSYVIPKVKHQLPEH